MDILLWILFGAIAGWIASMVMSAGGGTVWDIVMGVIGAIVGGYLMSFLGRPGVTGFNLYSLFVAVLGACVVIFIGRLFHRNV